MTGIRGHGHTCHGRVDQDTSRFGITFNKQSRMLIPDATDCTCKLSFYIPRGNIGQTADRTRGQRTIDGALWET